MRNGTYGRDGVAKIVTRSPNYIQGMKNNNTIERRQTSTFIPVGRLRCCRSTSHPVAVRVRVCVCVSACSFPVLYNMLRSQLFAK